MKLIILLLFILASFASCIMPRPFTRNERFIKDSIETHTAGEFTRSKHEKIYFSQTVTGDVHVFEVTGYEFNGKKGVVLGCGYVIESAQSGNVVTSYYRIYHVSLSQNEAGLLVANYQELINRVNNEPRNKNYSRDEFVYNDFALSESVFVSMKKTAYNPIPPSIDFWVNGRCASVSTGNARTLIEKLRTFLKP